MTITSLIFLVVVLFISFIIYFASLSDLTNRVQVLLESSHILVIANKLALDARMYGFHIRRPGFMRQRYFESLREDAAHLNFHAARVFIGYDAFSVPHSYVCPRTGEVAVNVVADVIIMNFIKNPSLVVSFYRHTNPVQTDLKLLNYWELILSFSNAAFEYIHDLSDRNAVTINRYFRFLSDNRSSLNLASFQFWHLLLTASEQFFSQSRLVSIISLIFSLLCVLIIGIFGFYRIMSRISLEREAVLNLFLLVPKSVCSQIVLDLKSKAKRKASKDVNSDQESDFESDDKSIDQSNDRIDLHETTVHSEGDVQHDSVNLELTDDNSVDEPISQSFTLTVILYVSLLLVILSVGILFFVYSFNDQQIAFPFAARFSVFKDLCSLLITDLAPLSRVYSFINTKDPFFYHELRSLENSLQRRVSLTELPSKPELSNELKEKIAGLSDSRSWLAHFNSISLFLTCNALNVSICEDLSDFDYDLMTEVGFVADSLVFPDSNWYSTPEVDLQLSNQEILKLLRDVVTSKRYYSRFSSLVNGFESVFHELVHGISSELIQFSDHLNSFMITTF
ncbi:hypothetical protein GEMRC1_013479 [Eukaryota sp. GEM-RC1]